MSNLITWLNVLSVLICSTSGWNLQTIHELIVGGETAKIQDVPYQAGLYFQEYYFCSGCVVTRWHILTAAHCVEFLPVYPRGLKVRVGTDKIRSGGQVLDVRRLLVHPKFNPRAIDYDVAVVQLKTAIKFNEAVRPIRVAKKEPKEGLEALVSGWGFIKETGPPSRKLRSVRVKIVNRETCIKSYEDIVDVTKRIICAAGDGKDACYGDSGGPMVLDGALVGVVSSGEGCARKEYPGLYTNLAQREIQKFIKKNTARPASANMSCPDWY